MKSIHNRHKRFLQQVTMLSFVNTGNIIFIAHFVLLAKMSQAFTSTLVHLPEIVRRNSNVLNAVTAPESKISSEGKTMFEFLKFDGSPKFDVLKKTKEYVETQTMGSTMLEEIYDKDYVLRGPVIGPINRADLAASQDGLDLKQGFPDLTIETFGYTVDPRNPYRCFYFQRWTGTHSVDMDIYGDIYPATNTEMDTPVATFCVVWTPEEKIIYEQVGSVVDRFEGNTQGKAAVFGMLHTAGLQLNANPGSKGFRFIQRLGHILGGRGRSWSREEDIPSWWISKSRGADPTDI